MKTKYIKTGEGMIIVFSEAQTHSEFRAFHPISAGFIVFRPTEEGVVCECYGESISLGLQSQEEDGKIATRQLVRGY